MKAQMQQGFTLIELMIVVAIIGILAAVALPQYQNYVGRANFASGLSTLSALRTNIESHIMEEGEFPGTADLTAEVLGMESTVGDLGEIALTNSGDGAGTAVFEFAKGNPGIKDKNITLERDESGVWTCTSDADDKFVRGCTAS